MALFWAISEGVFNQSELSKNNNVKRPNRKEERRNNTKLETRFLLVKVIGLYDNVSESK